MQRNMAIMKNFAFGKMQEKEKRRGTITTKEEWQTSNHSDSDGQSVEVRSSAIISATQHLEN